MKSEAEARIEAARMIANALDEAIARAKDANLETLEYILLMAKQEATRGAGRER